MVRVIPRQAASEELGSGRGIGCAGQLREERGGFRMAGVGCGFEPAGGGVGVFFAADAREVELGETIHAAGAAGGGLVVVKPEGSKVGGGFFLFRSCLS